jgi:hypothetical protein
LTENMCGTVHVDERGFGGNAPNKLKASAEGEGSELASDPCRRHGHKLVHYLFLADCKRKER